MAGHRPLSSGGVAFHVALNVAPSHQKRAVKELMMEKTIMRSSRITRMALSLGMPRRPQKKTTQKSPHPPNSEL